MAYQSLYRRYRPRRFSEVLGQDQVVGALRNAVRDERVGHAYLFSGPRGTGKTTTARILAKALNCTNLQGGEPDCECDSCLSIDAGTSYDLQELDAASNNKVENVRDLIERVALGSPGRTKVYILDEVHMLSAGASNALLKTLEEPPPHVVFVLATTDPHKVLPTIRSRTQHFEFHLLPADVLTEHVKWVIGDAGLDVSPEAIEQVVRQGGGSARDTLSALDQVAAAGGVTDSTEHAEALVDAVCAGDTGLALRSVADAVGAGRDPRILGEALLARLRDAFLVRMGAPLPQATENERQRAEAWAAQLTDRTTTRALEEVGAALLEMRQAPDPRIPLEVALVRLTRPTEGAAGDLGPLLDRIERLERAVAAGGFAPAAPAPAPIASAPAAAAAPTDRPAPPQPPADERAAPAATAPAPPPPANPTAAPPPPDAPRPRPGDIARQALAKAGAGGSAAAAPRPAATEPVAPPPPPPLPSTGRAAGAKPSPTSSPPEASIPPADAPPSAEASAPPAPAHASGALTDEAFLAGWDAVVGRLKGIAGAMYRTAEFAGLRGDAVTFSVGNDVERQRSEQHRPGVEEALGVEFGRPMRITLVVGRSGAADGPAAAAPPAPAPPEEDELIDVRDLEDAPADPRTGVDRLTEAFPGAELLPEEP